MQASWNSKTRKIVMSGQHKPRTPRLWSVTLRLANDEAKETMQFRPSGKMTLTDLAPLIDEHMDLFEKQHGTVTEASWVANAR